MHNVIVFTRQKFEHAGLSQIALEEMGLDVKFYIVELQMIERSAPEAVHHGDMMTLLQEAVNKIGADQPRAAGNEIGILFQAGMSMARHLRRETVPLRDIPVLVVFSTFGSFQPFPCPVC